MRAQAIIRDGLLAAADGIEGLVARCGIHEANNAIRAVRMTTRSVDGGPGDPVGAPSAVLTYPATTQVSALVPLLSITVNPTV